MRVTATLLLFVCSAFVADLAPNAALSFVCPIGPKGRISFQGRHAGAGIEFRKVRLLRLWLHQQ